jgi:hypothetical protein
MVSIDSLQCPPLADVNLGESVMSFSQQSFPDVFFVGDQTVTQSVINFCCKLFIFSHTEDDYQGESVISIDYLSSTYDTGVVYWGG